MRSIINVIAYAFHVLTHLFFYDPLQAHKDKEYQEKIARQIRERRKGDRTYHS